GSLPHLIVFSCENPVTCGSEPARDEASQITTLSLAYKFPTISPINSRTLHKMPLVAAPRDGLK
ncbi:hypothetical protein, partial [Pseudomonas sp. PS02303]|uniref:hypothetical protein n=1 Tax=Pseudomonas sp. PS02303 TaxID=2991429 RepID=UPI00249B499D